METYSVRLVKETQRGATRYERLPLEWLKSLTVWLRSVPPVGDDYLSLISPSGLDEEISLFSVCSSKVTELLQYCHSARSADPALRHVKTSVFTNRH